MEKVTLLYCFCDCFTSKIPPQQLLRWMLVSEHECREKLLSTLRVGLQEVCYNK